MMLEAIKQKRESLEQLINTESVNVSLLNDFNWLIQQAEENKRKTVALDEIITITKTMVKMNPTYDKIHRIALKGLGESE